ncbi:unnamed protein product [Closterium sp. NIES-65]|nr:unnamed protein product [Closterium sp. NIES-65]
MSVGDRRSASPSSNVPLGVALLVNASFAATELAISCRLRAPALPVTDLPKIGQPSAHRERDPPRSALRVDFRRGRGGVLWATMGFWAPRAIPPASALGGLWWPSGSAEWSGSRRSWSRGGSCAPDVAAPLRAPVLSKYLPAREGRALFRTPRQVPGFSVQPFSGGRLPGRETAYQREAPIAPPPTRAGRDPMLTMCRTLNLAEACEVVANLQMAVCGAMRNSPGSFAPGPRGSCATWAEALAPLLAPVSEAPAGVAPLARTFPRHVEDLLVAAQEGTPALDYMRAMEGKKCIVVHCTAPSKSLSLSPSPHPSHSLRTLSRQALDYMRATERKKSIIVHCTHGHNRTGFMIVHLLMRAMGGHVAERLAEFAEARPPGIYKEEYIQSLFTFYHERRPEAVICPPTPEWKATFDLDLDLNVALEMDEEDAGGGSGSGGGDDGNEECGAAVLPELVSLSPFESVPVGGGGGDDGKEECGAAVLPEPVSGSLEQVVSVDGKATFDLDLDLNVALEMDDEEAAEGGGEGGEGTTATRSAALPSCQSL